MRYLDIWTLMFAAVKDLVDVRSKKGIAFTFLFSDIYSNVQRLNTTLYFTPIHRRKKQEMLSWNRTGYGWWKLNLATVTWECTLFTCTSLELGVLQRKFLKWRWSYNVHGWKDQHPNSYSTTVRSGMMQKQGKYLKDTTDHTCFNRYRMTEPRKWPKSAILNQGCLGETNYYPL